MSRPVTGTRVQQFHAHRRSLRQSFDLSIHVQAALTSPRWATPTEVGAPEVLVRVAHVEAVVFRDVHAFHPLGWEV